MNEYIIITNKKILKVVSKGIIELSKELLEVIDEETIISITLGARDVDTSKLLVIDSLNY